MDESSRIRRTRYVDGGDAGADEVLHDRQGRVVDDEYVDVAVREALETARGRGRPSLSAAGESPLLRVRLSRQLDEEVREAARRAGTTRSEWVRRVLDDAVRHAG